MVQSVQFDFDHAHSSNSPYHEGINHTPVDFLQFLATILTEGAAVKNPTSIALLYETAEALSTLPPPGFLTCLPILTPAFTEWLKASDSVEADVAIVAYLKSLQKHGQAMPEAYLVLSSPILDRNDEALQVFVDLWNAHEQSYDPSEIWTERLKGIYEKSGGSLIVPKQPEIIVSIDFLHLGVISLAC